MKSAYSRSRKTAGAVTTAVLIFSSANLLAQENTEKEDPKDSRIEFVKTDNDTTVKNILVKDRSKNVNEVQVPHFAIHTMDNKFVMTIGAKFNPIIGSDIGSDLYKIEDAGINFIPSQIRVPSKGGRRSDFYINALNADIDFQIVGFGGTRNQLSGYLKFSTDGNEKSINLSKAYVAWRGLCAGLKSSLFVDDEAIPPTIDPQGPNGIVNTTVNEFSYITPTFKGLTFGIGIDMPKYYTSRGRYWGNDFQAWDGKEIEGETVCDPDYYSMQVPDIPLFAEYAKGHYRVKLAGIIRPKRYRDVLAEGRRVSVGWGLSLSGNLQPVEQLTFYLQATYGKGIGAYIQDLAGMPISFIPKDDKPGEMTPTPMMGWCAGISYQPNAKWQFNVMASQARVWGVSAYGIHEADKDTNINDYKYGYYGAANAFYNISSYFQVGVEYLYGFRKTWDIGSAHDNRIQFQVQATL